MNKIKKIVAALTSFSLAATMASCTPTIGAGSASAVTIDGYKVNAGIFIFYTISAYYEASNIVGEDSAQAPTIEDVKNAHIDNLEASEWIQNKATDYCASFVAVEKEFENINAELTDEEIDSVESNVDTYTEYEIYKENGIGEDSIRAILQSEYKRQHVFDYYYGFEGEKGMSEEELKDYFDDNFARVKYVSMSYLDPDGNEMDEAGKKEVRDLAEDYADEINSKSSVEDKLYAVNDAQEEYDEYVEELQAELATEATDAEGNVVTTTTAVTTTVNETTTTTTTNPHENERILQKQTTAATDENQEQATETTTEPSATVKSQQNLNKFVFEELTDYNKAVVFDDEANDAIYVVIRADLRERMTDDDLWTEDYISSLQNLNYNEDFGKYIEELADSYSLDKNNSAYRRYKPFKLVLETS